MQAGEDDLNAWEELPLLFEDAEAAPHRREHSLSQAGVYARETFAFYTTLNGYTLPRKRCRTKRGSERYVRSRMAVRSSPMESKEILT